MQDDLLKISSYDSAEGARHRSLLFRQLWKVGWRPDQDTRAGLNKAASDEQVAEIIRKDIIASLWFGSIDSRDKAISETYQSTYEWILDRNGSTGFTSWMEENQSSLYWITGKAGSGKSTLMKYLVHHKSTTQHLEKWAGELPLVFCHFYFWEATTEELQHSREGLLRTLLWRAFTLKPDIIEKVSARRWAAYNALRGWEGPVPKWSWEELQETFQNLASLNNSSLKLVMFIDGLDEFDGKPSTLIHWIKDIVTRFNIKLCVGSRPWTAFTDAFEQYPSLTMQTLTAPDIMIFINGHFETSRAFKDWQALSPDGAETLRKGLLEKADGVFLWVYVVVRDLMLALEKGKNLHDLNDIVDGLPTDIMELYTKIYRIVDPEDSKKAVLYFSLLNAAIHKLHIYELWSIEENTVIKPDDRPAWASMQSIYKRRLDSSTRGMIEVSTKEDVVFHHRSVKEWLSLPKVAPLISSLLPKSFDAMLLLVKGCRSRLDPSTYWGVGRDDVPQFFWTQLYLTMWYAARVEESPTSTCAVIQELEMARADADKAAKILRRQGHEWFYTLEIDIPSYKSMKAMESPPKKASRQIRAKHRRKPHPLTTGLSKADAFKLGHWTSTRHTFGLDTPSCFTTVAAEFAVIPYVMAQVRTNPNLLEAKDERISLLHSAIFGCQLYRYSKDLPPEDFRLRLRLIEALLDFGAPTKGRVHLTGISHNEEPKRYLDTLTFLLGLGNLDRMGPNAYWDDVRRLLSTRRRVARFRQSVRVMLDTDS